MEINADFVTLKAILAENNIDGKVARRKLRKAFPTHEPNEAWRFKRGSELNKALETLGVNVKPAPKKRAAKKKAA